MAKAGDVVKIGSDLCLLYKEGTELRNIKFGDCRRGGMKDKDIDTKPVIVENFLEIMKKVIRETCDT